MWDNARMTNFWCHFLIDWPLTNKISLRYCFPLGSKRSSVKCLGLTVAIAFLPTPPYPTPAPFPLTPSQLLPIFFVHPRCAPSLARIRSILRSLCPEKERKRWLVRSTLDRAVLFRALVEDIVWSSWARYLTITVSLFTQVYKWVQANCWGNLTNGRGVTIDYLASHPGGIEILLALSCNRNWDKLRQLWASHGFKVSRFLLNA